MTTNALLVLWHGGWRERIDYANISTGVRVEGLLGLGSIQSPQEADRVADAQLALFSTPRVEITVGTDPIGAADAPYLGYQLGDTVVANNITERVVAISISEDDNGVLTFVPQLRDSLPDEQERLNLAIKKMSNGTLGGSSKSATPISAVNTVSTQNNDPTSAIAAAEASVISLSLQKAANLGDVSSAATSRTNLGLGTAATQDSTAFQATDTELTALASTTSAADKVPYFTGSGTATTTNLTSYGRTLIGQASRASTQTELGINPGSAISAIGETFPRALVVGPTGIGNSQLWGGLILLPAGTISTARAFSVIASTTTTHSWAALYTTAGSLLGVSADQTLSWSGDRVFTFSGLSTPSSGFYYICFVAVHVAGTFQLMGGNNTSVGGIPTGPTSISPFSLVYDNTHTGLTTPATAPSTATFTIPPSASVPWAAVT